MGEQTATRCVFRNSFSAIITGTGFEVPKRVMTNAELEKLVNTSDEWITERTGVKERHIAGDDQASSDLGLVAARKALADARTDPEDVELIVVGTVTPDMPLPSTACIIQHQLGARNAAAMDVNAGCTGFIYALDVARHYIADGTYRTVLVVGAETLSRITDWTDRGTCILLGDGAGAAVVKASSEPDKGVVAGHLGADGRYGEALWVPGGGSRHPPTAETVKNGLHYLKMDGKTIFRVAVLNMVRTVRRLMEKTDLGPDDVDLIIPHQANLRIIEAVARQLHIPMERVFVNIQKYGNTSAATCIIALDEARKSGRIKPGDATILVAFGAGLTWGGVVIRW